MKHSCRSCRCRSLPRSRRTTSCLSTRPTSETGKRRVVPTSGRRAASCVPRCRSCARHRHIIRGTPGVVRRGTSLERSARAACVSRLQSRVPDPVLLRLLGAFQRKALATHMRAALGQPKAWPKITHPSACGGAASEATAPVRLRSDRSRRHGVREPMRRRSRRQRAPRAKGPWLSDPSA
jgi:hypothetical protein